MCAGLAIAGVFSYVLIVLGSTWRNDETIKPVVIPGRANTHLWILSPTNRTPELEDVTPPQDSWIFVIVARATKEDRHRWKVQSHR